jgi:DNA-binding transcriptional ArsR family regulator
MKIKSARRSKADEATRAMYAYPGLNRVIHERARLSVLTSLAAHARGLSFAEVKALSGLTDGNLSRHLQVLAASRLVEISKKSEGSRLQTHCQISALGRKRYGEYLLELERVVRDAAAAAKSLPRRRPSSD